MTEKQQRYKVQYLVYRLKGKQSSSSSASHNELIKNLAKNKQVLLFSQKQCKYFENLNFNETYIYFIQGKDLLYFMRVNRSNYDKVALFIQKLEFDDDQMTKSVTDSTNPYGESTKFDRLNILQTLKKNSKNESKFPQFYCQVEILSQFSKTSKKSLGSEFKFLFEEDDKNVQKVKDFYGHKLRDIISYPESMKKQINSEPQNYLISKKSQKESVQSKRKKSRQSESSDSSGSSDDSSDSSDDSSSQSDDSRKERKKKKAKSKALKEKKQEKQKIKGKDEKNSKRDKQKDDKKREKSKDRKSREKNSKERGEKHSSKQRKNQKSKSRKDDKRDDKRDDKKNVRKDDSRDNKHREKQKRSRSRDKQNKDRDFDKNEKKLSYKQNKDETKQRDNKSKSKPSEAYRKQNDKAKESIEIGTVASSLSKNDDDAKKKLQESISLQIQKSKKNPQGQQKQDKIEKKQEKRFEQEKPNKILESRADQKQTIKQEKKQQKNQFQSIFNKKKIPIEQRFSKL